MRVCLQLLNYLIASHFPWFSNPSSSPTEQRHFYRICRSMKWFTPLEWMPEVTSCPTSCLTTLAAYSAGKHPRPWPTRIGSSTSCGTPTAACTLTSPSTRTCWRRASWRRGGTAAWRGRAFAPGDPHSATSWAKCGMKTLLKEVQP